MKPRVIPWPQAGRVTSNPPSNKLATDLEILDFIALRTASFLSITAATSPSSQVACR